ncbi:MAG: porin [Gammaproteobacteria bacterium]|jgi:predicted porin
MHDKKTSYMSKGVALLALVTTAPAAALDVSFYGSLRVQGEYVDPDNQAALDSYTGLRDAYSRIGVNFEHAFNDSVTGYAKLELPLDIANLAVQDPWDQDEDIRIGKIGLKGRFGDIAVGQMWLPYYNAIAYPVDMFSSYYSGFATYTSFRKGDTVTWYSPSFSGFSFGAAFSKDNGWTDDDDRLQGTLSYKFDNLTIAGGIDDFGGDDNVRLWGLSGAWQATDQIYIGAKIETFDSDITSGYGADGDIAANLYGGYTMGKHTFKGMIAQVDNYGETIAHVGYDFQYNKDLKFFAEYYFEETTAAITTKRGGFAETCYACDGGNVFTVGLRYDFSAP